MKNILSLDREKDVLTLIKKVLNIDPNYQYNKKGANTSTCPFCYERVDYIDAEMAEIKHSQDCGYLIAKDLSTNLL